MVHPVDRSVFVGRDMERARLDAAFRSAVGGEGRVVLIIGEAGVGKTRLADTFTQSVDGLGGQVWRGSCPPSVGLGAPYTPFVQALRDHLRGVEPGRYPALLGPGRAELARLLPELSSGRPSDVVAVDPPLIDDITADRYGQTRLFEALLGCIEHAQRESPVVFVIDDLQWSDAATRELLAVLARDVVTRRILVVITARSDGIQPGDPTHALLAELGRDQHVDRLDLDGLDRGQVRALLSARAVDNDPAAVDMALERTGGNPFYIEQLSLLGSTDDPGAKLPAGLHDIMAARLAALSEPHRRVLRAAAAAGPRVDDVMLAAVLGLPEDEVADAVRAAIAAGLLVRVDRTTHGDGGYAFRHALLREAADADLMHGERQRLHRGYASYLVARGETGGGPVEPGEIASHWEAAGAPTLALPWLVAAGEDAERKSAYDTARRQYEHAIAAWPADALVEIGGMDRIGVVQRAAECAVLSGAYADAVALGRAAMDDLAAVDPGDTARMGGLHERLRWFLYEAGDIAGAAVEVERALDLTPATPPSPARARALGHAAGLRLTAGDMAGAAGLAMAAAEAARASDAPAQAAFALGVLGWSQAVGGDVDRGIATFREGLAIAEGLGGVEGISLGQANLVALLDRVGRTQDALDAATAGLATARRMGVVRTYGGVLAGHAAKASFDLGRWDAAAQITDDAIATDPLGPAAAWVRIVRARVASNRGRFAAATDDLRDARAVIAARPGSSPYVVPLLAAEVELAALQGRIDSVRQSLDAGIRHLDRASTVEPAIGWLAWHALRAEADAGEIARSTGDGAGSSAVDDRIAAIAAMTRDAVERTAGIADDRAPILLAMCRTEVERAHGVDSAGAWDDIARSWRAQGRPHLVAYARFRQGAAVLRIGGPRVEAAGALREAAAISASLGAEPLHRAVTILAGHARITLEAGDARSGTAEASGLLDRNDDDPARRLGLTVREEEVIRLLAAGRSNQEIADTLYMTRKTASVHVSNILGKLGVRNRVEAAAIAHQVGLGADAD